VRCELKIASLPHLPETQHSFRGPSASRTTVYQRPICTPLAILTPRTGGRGRVQRRYQHWRALFVTWDIAS